MDAYIITLRLFIKTAHILINLKKSKCQTYLAGKTGFKIQQNKEGQGILNAGQMIFFFKYSEIVTYYRATLQTTRHLTVYIHIHGVGQIYF